MIRVYKHFSLRKYSLIINLCIFWFFGLQQTSAQLISCDCIYYLKNDQICKFDPGKPLSSTNPDTTGIHITNSPDIGTYTYGLAISDNLNGAGPSPTFYTVIFNTIAGSMTYYYYDGTKWVNTGHKASCVNIGAGGGYIFGLAGESGKICRYDGKGDDKQITQINDFRYEGPFDLIVDCIGDWYLLNSTGNSAPRTLRKFDFNGNLLQTWSVYNPHGYSGSAGFAIIGNTIYSDDNSQGYIFSADINSDTIKFTKPTFNVWCGANDMASCAAAIPITPTISITSSCNNTIPQSVTFVAKSYAGGTTPIFQWKINGINAGSNNDTLTYNPSIGDKVVCEITSNAPCTTQTTAISNQIEIKSLTPPILTLDKTPIFCPGGSVLLHASGADTYTWSTGKTGDSISIATAGTYSVTGTVNGGCTGTLSFNTSKASKPNYKIKYQLTNCNNHTYQFYAIEANGNILSDNFFWDFGDGTTSSIRQPIHSFSASGQITVKLITTNTFGCDSTCSQVITVPDLPTLSINKAALFCIGDSVVIRAKGAQNYLWQNGSTNDSICIKSIGSYSFTGTSSDGCTNTYNFTAANYPQPDYSIVSKLTDCNSRSYQFTANVLSGQKVNDSYHWEFGDGSSANTMTANHAFPSPINYTITLIVSSPNVCNSYYKKDISVEAPPVLSADNQPKFCREIPMTVTVQGAAYYKWDDGSTSDKLIISKEGNYSVTGISPAGCTSIYNFSTSYFDLFNYTINNDWNEVATAHTTINFWSDTIPSSIYYWDFGDGQMAMGNNQQNTYTISHDGYFDISLKVINPYGCTEQAVKRLWITNSANINSFTPNGDGKNDLFLKDWHIQVFNREGILLYDGTEGWNGKYKGTPVAKDTYLYLVYYQTESGIKSKPGYVMVIR